MKRLLPLLLLALTSHAAMAFDFSYTNGFGNSTFGASMFLGALDTRTSTRYTIKGIADAKARLFATDLTVAAANAQFQVEKDEDEDDETNGSASADMRVLGITLFDYSKTFKSTTPLSTTTYVKSVTFLKTRFFVSVVPLSVKVSGSLSARGAGEVTVTHNDNAFPTVAGRFGPVVEIAVEATAGVDAFIFAGGVRGSSTLGALDVMGSAKISPIGNKHGRCDFSADWGLNGPDGTLSLWASLSYLTWTGFKTKYWNTDIASFRTFRKTGNLARGGFQVW